MGEGEAKRQSARRTPSEQSRRHSSNTEPILSSSPRPSGRRPSSVEETLTKGELPPQFDLDGRITTGSWLEAKTSLMRTVSLGMPPVMSHLDNDWIKHGACVGNPEMVDLMFRHDCTHECTVTNGKRCSEDSRVDAAKSICDACPVLDHCRWWAVLTNLLFGVAGGMTRAERLVVRKRLKKTAFGKQLLAGDVEISWD